MAKSKIAEILKVLKAAGHVTRCDALTFYHDARACRDALRSPDYFAKARTALKNYRVRVQHAPAGGSAKLVISTFDRSAEAVV